MTNDLKFTNTGHSIATQIVNAINILGGDAKIEKTWLDHGAGSSWEAILFYVGSLKMYCQLLSPKDFDRINNGDISSERIRELVYYAVEKF